MEKKMSKLIIIFLFSLTIINIGVIFFSKYSKSRMMDKDKIIVMYNNEVNVNNEYSVDIQYKDDINIECSIDDINYSSKCNYKLKAGLYNIYVRHNNAKAYTNLIIETNYEGTFKSTLDNVSEYYLALNGTKKIDFEFDYPYDFDKTIQYTIDDPSIIEIKDNTIKGLKNGTTYLHARLKDGNNKKYKITVTDLIEPINYNKNKSYLPCKRYTEEEAHLLDKILESRVQEAGVGTRGGVVAAARFITLEFPYSIRYFNENGRLVNYGGHPYIDAEGRYYHKGLYLSEDKYKDILYSTATGPKIWGCEIYDSFISRMNMNGFTCSGFVTWAMFNGGFDVGDVGAGDYTYITDELSDLGPHHEITQEYMKSGNYKVGDFIGRDGHAALIIGISDTTVYTAESLPPKLEVYVYERYNGIVKDENVTYVIEMGNVYPNGDGWYTNMW